MGGVVQGSLDGQVDLGDPILGATGTAAVHASPSASFAVFRGAASQVQASEPEFAIDGVLFQFAKVSVVFMWSVARHHGPSVPLTVLRGVLCMSISRFYCSLGARHPFLHPMCSSAVASPSNAHIVFAGNVSAFFSRTRFGA